MLFPYRLSTRIFRSARMRRFYARFGITSTTRVLDVGGTLLNWSLCSFKPKLTIINLFSPKHSQPQQIEWLIADGRRLPFKDKSFDVVYSNSVIEHLGSWENQLIFSDEVRRVGVSYFIQTPSKYFPIEPHLLTPFIHYLPAHVQRKLLRNGTLWGLITRPSQEQCDRLHQEIRLLSANELEQLFPEAQIYRERVLGLTKSYYCEFHGS